MAERSFLTGACLFSLAVPPTGPLLRGRGAFWMLANNESGGAFRQRRAEPKLTASPDGFNQTPAYFRFSAGESSL